MSSDEPVNQRKPIAFAATNNNNNNNNNNGASSSTSYSPSVASNVEPTTTATTAPPPPKPKAFSALVLPGESLVKTLTNPAFHAHEAVVVKKSNGEYVVRKAYPPTHRNLTDRAITITKLAGRHPCCTMPLSATRHKDFSVNVEEEFSDGADLQFYLERIKTKLQSFDNLSMNEKAANKDYAEFRSHQVQFAKSVARQLIEYVFWLETVIRDAPHRNINPNTILLRRDGSIKMKFFNYFTEEMVEQNPFHYFKCAYCSAECSRSLQGRMEAGYANDIWAIGAVLFSIITGESYLPEYARKDPYKVSAGQSPPADSATGCSSLRGSSHSANTNRSVFDFDTTNRSNSVRNTTEIAQMPESDESRAQHDRAQTTKYDEFMKFVDEATLSQWFERCGDPALAFLIKMCLTRDKNSRPTAEKLLAFMYVAGTGMTQSNYAQPSSTFEERCKLTKIVVPGRAYSRVKNKENVEIGWSMVLHWGQTYDAWGTDMAQLSQGYFSEPPQVATKPEQPHTPSTTSVADTSLPPATDQSRAAKERLFGEQLYLLLRQNELDGGGPHRMYQHMLLFSEILHFSYPLTADVKYLQATFVRRNLGINLEGELNSLMKIVTVNQISAVLEEESRVQNTERNKKIGDNKIDTAARTAIDKQRRQVISGRLSCSMIAMSRAMCFLRNGYMANQFSRVPNAVEQEEMDDARIAKEIAAKATAGPNSRTTGAEKQDKADPDP